MNLSLEQGEDTILKQWPCGAIAGKAILDAVEVTKFSPNDGDGTLYLLDTYGDIVENVNAERVLVGIQALLPA